MYGIQRCREGEKKVQIRIKVIKKRPGPLSGCVGLYGETIHVQFKAGAECKRSCSFQIILLLQLFVPKGEEPQGRSLHGGPSLGLTMIKLW
jgi:hypothetical protein